jgi:hypothetical protein
MEPFVTGGSTQAVALASVGSPIELEGSIEMYSFLQTRPKSGSRRFLTLSTDAASHKEIAVERSLLVTVYAAWCRRGCLSPRSTRWPKTHRDR